MNRDKLNKFALQIANDIMKAKPSITLDAAMGVVNYKLANIASQLRLHIDTKSGFGITPANIYQLTLLNSGAGKGASLGLVDQFYFSNTFDYIDDEIFPKFREHALAKLADKGNDRTIHKWVKSVSNFTTSGLFAYAEAYSLSGFGGINIEVDEIGNAITSKAELFEILLQPYDNGIYDPVGKRTDPDAMTIKGLSTNLYCFGNKVKLFEGDSIEAAFIKLLDEGYGRRMIFVDDHSKPDSTTAEAVISEMNNSEEIKAKRANDRERIRLLITSKNLGKVMELDSEARFVFATIKAEGMNYIVENKGLPQAVMSDMTERFFKTAKLAGIYAFFDGNEKITKKNMIEAFEIIKESSKVLANLRKVRPIHERLLDKLIDEENKVTSQTMLSYPFINSTWTKKIEEIIKLAKELASENGIDWKETKHRGVTYYQAKKPTEDEIKEYSEIDEVEKKRQAELIAELYD